MASFTSVDDELTLSIPDKGETIDIALSGTYNMVIKLYREAVPYSGSWIELRTVSGAANATVATTYESESYDERIKLRVTTDTSGTCTATLTDNSNLVSKSFKDRVGNNLLELSQKFTKVYGGLVRTSASIVNTTVLLTLNERDHAGRTVTANNTTGFAITLPEATGTGNVYTVFYGTTVSSGNHTIVAPSAATSFVGGVGLSTDIAGVTILANVADDTITMNGSTSGGVKGSWVRFTDVYSGLFMLEGFLCSTGAEADPFSAGVS